VYEVMVEDLAPERLASVAAERPVAELPEFISASFGLVMTVIQDQGLRTTGGAVAVYHSWTQDSVEVEVGFTVDAEVRSEQGVGPSRLPGGRALKAVHVGLYEDVAPAYDAIQQHAARNGLELAGMMWERYLSDPVEEPDLSKHVTEIYWPVAQPVG